MEPTQLNWIANFIWSFAGKPVVVEYEPNIDPRDTEQVSLFYNPRILPTLKEIRADIPALEKEAEGMLDEIMGKV